MLSEVHVKCVRSLSESGSDRDQKRKKINMLHEGFKKWNAKRKLQYDIISKENEPPAKRMTRALEVSTFFFNRES